MMHSIPYTTTRFDSTRIIVSDCALEETEERLFPESRHRSARIRKKLIRRHGGEFVMKPCIFSTPQGFIVHPSIEKKLAAVMSETTKKYMMNAWM